jgi:hypothetical protein
VCPSANGWQHTERDPAAVADAARGVVERGYRAVRTPNMRILEPFDGFADAWAAELVDEALTVSAADGCFASRPFRAGAQVRS